MELYPEAIARFTGLVEQAGSTSLSEPLAMTLATVDWEGQPSARIVLLRGYDERGFVFYTNTRSRKGEQIAANPLVALCFYWDELNEQVRIEGKTERVPDDEADAYWANRPRGSQIGAWASDQSQTLPERKELEDRIAEREAEFANQDVPRPVHWTGFRVVPNRIEFWVRGESRLHTRTVYELSGEKWSKRELYP